MNNTNEYTEMQVYFLSNGSSHLFATSFCNNCEVSTHACIEVETSILKYNSKIIKFTAAKKRKKRYFFDINIVHAVYIKMFVHVFG